jgi:hypothetical protein
LYPLAGRNGLSSELSLLLEAARLVLVYAFGSVVSLCIPFRPMSTCEHSCSCFHMCTWSVAGLACSHASGAYTAVFVEDTTSCSSWTGRIRQGEGGADWVSITCSITGFCCVDLSLLVSIRLRDQGAELQTIVIGSTVAGLLWFLDPCWLPGIVHAVGTSGFALSLLELMGCACISLIFVGIMLWQMSAFQSSLAWFHIWCWHIAALSHDGSSMCASS